MKPIITFLLVCLAVAALCFGAIHVLKNDPGKLSDLDRNVLQRTQAQLELLQAKYQKEAQPLLDEQLGTLNRVCAGVNAKPGVDCTVNLEKGTVVKQAPAPPPPPKK